MRGILKSDWFLSCLILIVFLLTNGYQYNWDDQHVEIPLLKSLIDPSLYVGDYYVESLKKNFTSFMYPLLSRIITLDQIPAVYFLLYLLSRYFLFFWVYKIWKYISGQKLTAFLCAVMFVLIGRVPEFLYRTFSHQEFALGIIFAGIYFFYKERFVLASAILGCAANFHALYALFPMIFLEIFLMRDLKKYKFVSFLKSSVAFLICALPFLIWTAKRLLSAPAAEDPGIYENWVALYKIACPQNFLFLEVPLNAIFKDFKNFEQAIPRYLILIVLFALNAVHHEAFRKDRKMTACALGTLGLLLALFFFSYIQPNRLILDLNLARGAQYLLLFLMGYTMILLLKVSEEFPLWMSIPLAMMFYLLGFGDLIATLSALAMFFLIAALRLFYRHSARPGPPVVKAGAGRMTQVILFCALFLTAVAGMVIFMKYKFNPSVFLKLYSGTAWIFLGFLVVVLGKKIAKVNLSPKILIMIPLILMFVQYGRYHWDHLKVQKYGGGFWQLQRDWEDMQRFVKDHTPKNALFMIPNDMEMGGFRILSERKIICCYRDCGIVGFDYKAALEWQRRLADIGSFKVIANQSIKPAILNALFKYHVDYIVFMRYYAPDPQAPGLEKIYENRSFSLFQVKLHHFP